MSGGRWTGGRGGRRGSGSGDGGGERRQPRRREPPRRVEGPPSNATGASERRAGSADRDEHLYAKKRAGQRRRRDALEKRAFDPAPADPDTEWTVEDGTGLRRTTAPSPIGDAVRQLLADKRWDERLSGSTASQRWVDIVGADLAARCEPVRLAGGTLVVRAESQVWATQLRYVLPHLRARAEEVLGEGRVREVRLVVGPLEGAGEEL